MSRPCSLASRRAFGEILMLVDAGEEDAATAGPEGFDCSVLLRPVAAAVADGAGTCSPGATIHAMISPTGTTAPSCDFTPARIPPAGDSISTTALSVSISRSGSPLPTLSPSFLRQARSLPVSWAISNAGITTLIAIGFSNGLWDGLVRGRYSFGFCAGFDHFTNAATRRSFVLAGGGQGTIHGEIVGAGDHKIFSRETCDDFVTSFGNDNFFLDARGTPAVGGGPERLESKHHSWFDFVRMLE